MLLHPFRKDETASEGRVVSLDQTGLGVFDAFFASLSMIIVSEVCVLDFAHGFSKFGS